jgi:hypothetical protein
MGAYGMHQAEKYAWFSLGVVTVTVAVYCALGAFFGFGPATNSVFSLLALLAWQPGKRGEAVEFDERDREFSKKALLAGLRIFYIVFVCVPLVLGFVKGWDSVVTLPMWAIARTIWLAGALIMFTRSLVIIKLYRSAQ